MSRNSVTNMVRFSVGPGSKVSTRSSTRDLQPALTYLCISRPPMQLSTFVEHPVRGLTDMLEVQFCFVYRHVIDQSSKYLEYCQQRRGPFHLTQGLTISKATIVIRSTFVLTGFATNSALDGLLMISRRATKDNRDINHDKPFCPGAFSATSSGWSCSASSSFISGTASVCTPSAEVAVSCD